MRRIFLVLALSAAGLAGKQSATVVSGSPSFTLPSGAPWNTMGSNKQPMRWEMRLHGFDPQTPTFGPFAPPIGVRWHGGGYGVAAETSFHADSIQDNWVYIPSMRWTDVLVRIQRDVANTRYTFEVCDVTGQGGCLSAVSGITAYGSSSWSGLTMSLSGPGYSVSFLRWFSTVVPLGTPLPLYGVAGDIADWEFEGTLKDSVAGLRFSGGSVSYGPAPVYPPLCNPGAQQSFRAGYPAQLDATGSQALDGGTTLTYFWQQAANVSPVNVNWLSSHSAARPNIDGLVFGSYNFQLTVTDGSGQSSACVVHHGAVATDDNGVVITDNPALDTLLGPMIQFGRNPWPWMDDRNQYTADVQAFNLDNYYIDYWDTAAAGTISVTTGSVAIVGSGTHFTTDFCGKGGDPTVPLDGVYFVFWWNGGANRRLTGVKSCADDTHMTIDNQWGITPTTESGLKYTIATTGVSTWQFGGNAQYPANYYDNVAAFYALYYRSGFDKYLTYARKLADRFWASPVIDQGQVYGVNTGGGYGLSGRGASAMGLILRALDGRPEMWSGLHIIWDHDIYNMPIWTGWGLPGMYDQREQGYILMRLAMCGLFDSDAGYRSSCKAAVKNSIAGTWSPVLSHFPDYSWPQWAGCCGKQIQSQNTAKYATVVNGSGTVTLNGGTWASTDFATTGQVWFYNCSSGMGTSCVVPANNSGGDAEFYNLSFVDSTHAVLSDVNGNPTTYSGTSGNKGFVYFQTSDGAIAALGWESQPFMVGIIGSAFDLAAQAMYDGDFDPASGALFYQYAHGTARWLATSAYRPSTKGLYYFVGSVNCPTGNISENATWCQAGGSPSSPQADRILNAEAVRALMFNWLHDSHDPVLAKTIDTMVNAEWAKPGTCPVGSTVCVPDGYYLPSYDNGGVWVAGAPPSHANPKWFGMPFGLNPQPSWPAMRIGGPLPPHTIRKRIGLNLPAVPGAAAVRVVATAPNGTVTQTQCAASPCAVTLDDRQGGYLLRLEYVSPSNRVLALSGLALNSSQ